MYRRKYSAKFTEAGQPFVKGLAQLSPFMTIPELQAYLHICRRTAYTLVHQEGFPAYRVGRSIRIDRKELEDWMRRRFLRPPSPIRRWTRAVSSLSCFAGRETPTWIGL